MSALVTELLTVETTLSSPNIDNAGATLDIGAAATTVNIGNSGSTVNILGTLLYENVTNLTVTDALITLNKGGAAASGGGSGFEIEENSLITGYIKQSSTRNGYDIKASNISGVATISLASLTAARTFTLPDATGTFALTSDLHNAVTIGTANGLSISGSQVLSLQLSSASQTGALSSTDWTTFNNKQAGSAVLTALAGLPGNGIVAQTGATSFTNRTITGSSIVSVSNGDGVAGNPTLDISNASITNAKLANMANSTIKGRATAGTGSPEDLTASQVLTILGIGGARIIKTGTVTGGSFAGNPKTFAVTFSTPFPNTNYTIAISGGNNRSWSFSSKATTGFTINANANAALSNNVDWTCISTGESVE